MRSSDVWLKCDNQFFDVSSKCLKNAFNLFNTKKSSACFVSSHGTLRLFFADMYARKHHHIYLYHIFSILLILLFFIIIFMLKVQRVFESRVFSMCKYEGNQTLTLCTRTLLMIKKKYEEDVWGLSPYVNSQSIINTPAVPLQNVSFLQLHG